MDSSNNSCKPTLLLVDDDLGFLKLLSMRLEHENYQVKTASNGLNAMDQIKISLPDIVITDLKMDKMDGMTLFEEIRSIAPSLPVIIITAHGTIPDAVKAVQKGVFSFVSKPIDKHELIHAINKALLVSGKGKESLKNGSGKIEDKIFLTQNTKMLEILSQAKLVAASDANVQIFGESGTGKELLAKMIHQYSSRKDKPFVAINCGAMPEHLLESELFGHVKGAFSGAVADNLGVFQAVSGGTLFLDEIGDMPPSLQVKLLRALQERNVKPVGSVKTIPVDIRVISATHRNLEMAIKSNEFREDLYYRLKVVTLEIPNLSDRRDDIPIIANYFLEKYSKQHKSISHTLAPDAMDLLIQAPWPGNIRQLQNVIEEVVALSTSPIISAALVQKSLKLVDAKILSFHEARAEFDRSYLIEVIKLAEGNISKAARLAGRNRTEFYKLIAKHNIDLSLYKKSLSKKD